MKDYKQLAEMIYKRKSVREFSKKSAKILESDIDLMETLGITPLVDNIRVKVKILRAAEVKNKRSDYCLAFYSEEKPLYLENMGFIGQQIDLELQSKGLGTCWWGMKKPNRQYKNIDGLGCVITMTVGYPQADENRVYPDGFTRKPLNEIVIGNSSKNDSAPDCLIEAARIAPSAINLQPWLIEKTDNNYNFYIRQPKGFMEKLIKSMRHIDLGISMAHLFVQAKAKELNVSFNFNGKDIKQGRYVGTVCVG